ncbi:MAG: hypothetical protein WEC59_11020 [Salibacteraceae bacterium]
MSDNKEPLDAIKDIKAMMERSSRFISLSGLAGVFSGAFALIGAGAAYWRVNLAPWAVREMDTEFGTGRIVDIDESVAYFLIFDALLVLISSILVSLYFTKRKANMKNLPIWGSGSKHMLINLSIPLITGGIFCLLLFYHGLIGLIAPVTLVFYGLALMNAGRFSLEEISYLGLSEIILGLLSLFFLGYGLLFWAVGFGVLHIGYGIVMYLRHDR